ncbi:hypothetical protein [Bacillus sp. T33-2]|nr:hypothetical protein [Bacillus sp. T33-2]
MFNLFKKTEKGSSCCNVKIEEVKEEKKASSKETQHCCSADDDQECS